MRVATRQIARKNEKKHANRFEIYTRAGLVSGAFEVRGQEVRHLCEEIRKRQPPAEGAGTVLARLTKRQQSQMHLETKGTSVGMWVGG